MRRPVQGREPAGYEHEFLEDYIPNHTCYLPEHIRRDLSLIGEIRKPAPTGSTYQPETVNRLLVDLSWASSWLEGNTYSLIMVSAWKSSMHGSRIKVVRRGNCHRSCPWGDAEAG